jgi:uncharacterized protein
MKKTMIIAISLLLVLPLWSSAQEKLPVPSAPQSWVNDYAGVFSSAESNALEQKLNEFEYRTSTQIFVVTLDDNGGYSASDLGQRILRKVGSSLLKTRCGIRGSERSRNCLHIV